MTENEKLLSLVKWLLGEKFLIGKYPTDMTEEFEKEHQWELSRNRMIDKTINKIQELIDEEG